MKLPLLKDIDVKGKRVFLRADLDVPIAEGTVDDDTRLKAALPTIQYLLEQGATVIVAGHLGRPTGVDKSLSLEPVARWLSERFCSSHDSLQDWRHGWHLSHPSCMRLNQS